jgi:hypothetical protein
MPSFCTQETTSTWQRMACCSSAARTGVSAVSRASAWSTLFSTNSVLSWVRYWRYSSVNRSLLSYHAVAPTALTFGILISFIVMTSYLNIHHNNADVSVGGALLRASHAFFLNEIFRFSEPGRVTHQHRIPSNIERHLNDISCRTSDGRHNRSGAKSENIEQTTLAGIRRPDNRDLDTTAHDFTAPAVGEMATDRFRKGLYSVRMNSVASFSRVVATTVTVIRTSGRQPCRRHP